MPYQMKNGKWRAERQIEGKRHTCVCETRRAALDWESGAKKQQEIVEEIRTATVLEWLNQYLDYSLERHTRIVYLAKRRVSKIFLAVVDEKTASTDIRPATVLHVMRHAAKKGCADTANLCRKHLSAAWNWGIKFMELPPLNPFLQVEKFPVDQKPRRVPAESEFWKVVNSAQERDKRFLIACLHTAARKSELFRLTWSDVDFERGFILLGTRKRKGGGMEYDPVPMTSMLRRILLEQQEEGLCGERVFCHVDGAPYTTRERLISRLCKKYGIPCFSLHGIRHLTASILAREGVPMTQIQAILRHRRLATTEIYISRISPLENVLEGVFGERQRPGAIGAEPLLKVPHGGPHACVETQKLQ
jgi:integrase